MKNKSKKLLTTHYSLLTKKGGFTIVESLVAMFIFTLTIGVTVGSLMFSLTAQRIVYAEKQVSETVNFAIEFMSRQLRVAQRDTTGVCITPNKIFEMEDLDGDGDSDQITFLNADDICMRFTLDSTAGEINLVEDPSGVADTVNLTNSESADITDVDFTTLGEPSSDDIQARVSIVIHAEGVGPTQEEQAVSFDIQTTVTSRRLDTF